MWSVGYWNRVIIVLRVHFWRFMFFPYFDNISIRQNSNIDHIINGSEKKWTIILSIPITHFRSRGRNHDGAVHLLLTARSNPALLPMPPRWLVPLPSENRRWLWHLRIPRLGSGAARRLFRLKLRLPHCPLSWKSWRVFQVYKLKSHSAARRYSAFSTMFWKVR